MITENIANILLIDKTTEQKLDHILAEIKNISGKIDKIELDVLKINQLLVNLESQNSELKCEVTEHGTQEEG